MLASVYQSISLTHIILGSLALLLFWGPLLSKKGGPVHRKTGRYYSLCMHLVGASGILMTALVWAMPMAVKPELMSRAVSDPALYQRVMDQNAFLFLLSLLSWVTIRHAQLSLKTRQERSVLRHWSVLGPVALLLAVSLSELAYFGFSQPLVLVFAFIGIGTSTGILRYSFATTVDTRAWLVEHAASMLGSGIAAYTAFSAFGGRALFSAILHGYWQLLPWLLPSLVGFPLILWYRRTLSK